MLPLFFLPLVQFSPLLTQNATLAQPDSQPVAELSNSTPQLLKPSSNGLELLPLLPNLVRTSLKEPTSSIMLSASSKQSPLGTMDLDQLLMELLLSPLLSLQ